MEAFANNYTIWAGISLNTSEPEVTLWSELPYAIHITASLLPAAVYPEKEPNVFFSLISNYLARGARKFDYSGFSYLQTSVEVSLVNFKLNRLNYTQQAAGTPAVSAKIWAVPYESPFNSIPLIILLSASMLQTAYIPAIILAAFDLVSERKSKSFMKLMGMQELLYQTSWAIYIFASTLVTSIIIYVGSAILGLMRGIAGRALLIVLLFSLSLTALVFLIAGLSRSKQVAAVLAITVIGFVPNSLAIFLTNAAPSSKAIFSLFSPVAFVFSIVECLKSHLIQANKLAIIPDEILALGEYSLPLGISMLVLDTVLYFALGWYFYNVHTKRNPKPYYFCCIPSYWRRGSTNLAPDSESSLDIAIDTSNNGISSSATEAGSEGATSPRLTDSARLNTPNSRNFESIVWPSDEANSGRERSQQAKKAMMEEMERLGKFAQPQDPRRRFATTKLPAPFGIGLRLSSVSKSFTTAAKGDNSDHFVLRNISFEAMRNEVLVLVGERGSGKTALIQLMAGLTTPTEGSVHIEGLDLVYNRRDARSMLSLCTQESHMFYDLSVREHVTLSSRLKCMPDADETTRIDHLLDSLQLLPIQYRRISDCSLAEKKRVAVAIAFSGDSKVVLLDEPTSGLDPESREAIWNAIQANKTGRTIIAVTHLMSEADAIGDRVGILNRGTLVALGSPSFLKRRFGVGYYLNITKTPATATTNEIIEFVQHRLAGVRVLYHHPSSSLLRFTLPFSEQPKYPDLFQDLETQIDAHSALGIEAYSVSLTTLEDIFEQQVNSELDDEHSDDAPEHGKLTPRLHMSNSALTSSDTSVDISQLNAKDILPTPNSRSASHWQQLSALVKMRTKLVLRDTPSLVFLLLVPLIAVLLIWITAIFGNSSLQILQILNGTRTSASVAPVDLSYDTLFPIHIPYVDESSISTQSTSSIPDGFEGAIRLWNASFPDHVNLTGNKLTSHSALGDFLWRNADPGHRLAAWIIEGWSFNAGQHSVGLLYNKTESYSLPVVKNLLSNTILGSYLLRNVTSENELGSNGNNLTVTAEQLAKMMSSIRVTMDPFDKIPNIKAISYNFDASLLSSFSLFDVALSLGLATCLAMLLALFTQERVKERVLKVRLQQLMLGASLHVYWLSNAVIDSVRLVVAFAVIIISGTILQFGILYGMYLGAFVILALLWIPCVLLMAYVISGFFSAPKSCYKWILLVYWSMYVSNYVVVFAIQLSRLVVLKTHSTGPVSAFFLSYFSFFNPFSTLSSALFDLGTVQKDFEIHNIRPSFAYLMSWNRLGRHLCFIGLHTVFWAAILCLTGPLAAYLRRRNALNSLPSTASAAASLRLSELDSSTYSESAEIESLFDEDIDIRRIRTRISAGEYENAVVRVDNMTRYGSQVGWLSRFRYIYDAQKTFSLKDISEQAEEIQAATVNGHIPETHGTEVENAYFVVQPGECFGILGPRNSGKSILLSLLTGEIPPHSGNIEVSGVSACINLNSFYHAARISYVPPNGVFNCFEHLTVLENLQLFFSLRIHLQTAELNALTDYAIVKMELKAHKHILCKDVPTAARRRLCLAIALFTGSRVIILDNPTSEMEMPAKVKFWRMLEQIREETGVSIVLSTTSMKEATTTCDHYGIFVKGRFQAMGSRDYLRNRFEEGYHLKILQESDTSQIDSHESDEPSNGQHDQQSGDVAIELEPIQEASKPFDDLDIFVKENFSNSRRLVSYGRERTYFLGIVESPAWAFDLLETNKSILKIAEYSLSQTTLLEVYNQFSRNQEIPSF